MWEKKDKEQANLQGFFSSSRVQKEKEKKKSPASKSGNADYLCHSENFLTESQWVSVGAVSELQKGGCVEERGALLCLCHTFLCLCLNPSS